VTRLALLLVLCATPACDRGADRIVRVEAPEAAAGPSLLEQEPLENALRVLVKAVPKPIRALELVVTRERVVLQAQHPEERDSLVQFEYAAGAIKGPVPIELRGAGELQHNLFPLEDVALDRIPALAKMAVLRVDPADGEVTRVVVRRALPVDERVEMRLFVKSPRRDGHLDADATGKPLGEG